MNKFIWVESAQNYPVYRSPRYWIGYKTKSGKETGIGMSLWGWAGLSFMVLLIAL